MVVSMEDKNTTKQKQSQPLQSTHKKKVLGFISDGITLEDFEKIILGILLVITTLTAVGIYIAKLIQSILLKEVDFFAGVDGNFVLIITSLVAGFVARKWTSYTKPQQYYDYHDNYSYNANSSQKQTPNLPYNPSNDEPI
jgi:hypothetical protein